MFQFSQRSVCELESSDGAGQSSGVYPVVGAGLLHKFSYVFASLSPHDSAMDSLIVPWLNASTMSMFLSSVALAHPDEYIGMVMDLTLSKGLRSLESDPQQMQSFRPALMLVVSWRCLRQRQATRPLRPRRSTPLWFVATTLRLRGHCRPWCQQSTLTTWRQW